MLMLDPTP